MGQRPDYTSFGFSGVYFMSFGGAKIQDLKKFGWTECPYKTPEYIYVYIIYMYIHIYLELSIQTQNGNAFFSFDP